MSNAIIEQLTRIADALELSNNIQLSQIAAHDTERVAPNLRRPLNAYADFDPASIGATGIAQDRSGWTELEWGGRIFKRYRSTDDDEKGQDIRFRRVRSGTVSTQDIVWETLIKFADRKPAKPLRGELAERIAEAQAGQGGQGQPQGIAPTAPTAPPKTTTPTPAPKAQAPAPAATKIAAPPAPEDPKPSPGESIGRVMLAKAEKDANKIADALRHGLTFKDLAAALNGSNGPNLFWAACRHWIVSKPLADDIVATHTNAQRVTNWGAALNQLGAAISADPF